MIAAAELADMRSTVTGSLPDTAQIKRDNDDRDGGGWQAASTWPVVATWACRIEEDVRPADVEEGDAPQADTRWILTLPHDATVLPTDRVTVNGNDYEVIGSDQEETERLAVTVYLRRMK